MTFATLRSRIVALLILSSLGLAAALAVVIGNRVSEGVRAQIGAALTERAVELAESLDREMAIRISEVRVLASLDVVRRLDRPHQIRYTIDGLQASIPEFSWVGVLDTAGTVVASTNGVLQGANIAQRPVFQEGIKGSFIGDVHDAVLLARLLPNPSGEPVKFVDIATRLRDVDGETVGVFAAHLSWQWARQIETSMMTRLGDRPALELFVVSADGTILLAPDSGLHGTPLALGSVAGAQAGRKAWTIETWPDGHDYVTGFAGGGGRSDFEGLGWVVLARQPVADAFAPVADLLRDIALIGAGFALIAALIGWVAATSIVAPLNRIARAAEAIRRDRGGRFPPVGGPREIQTVSDAIEDLVDTVFEKNEALVALESQAYRDPLTGLANRAALDRFLASGDLTGRPYALACVDLDGFKAINDNLGHAAGDDVLRQVAARLESCMRGGDLLIRQGGDEFVAILPMPASERDAPARRVGGRIVDEIARSFSVDGREVSIGASVGLAFFPRDGAELSEVLRHADMALYRAKHRGRRRVEVFDGAVGPGDD